MLKQYTRTLIMFSEPRIITKIKKFKDEDEYIGYVIEMNKGMFELRISREMPCCEKMHAVCSTAKSDLKGARVDGIIYAVNESDIPSLEITEKLCLTNEYDKSYLNWTGIVLLNGEHERTYFSVCNIHNGFYSHLTEFIKDNNVIYKTWL